MVLKLQIVDKKNSSESDKRKLEDISLSVFNFIEHIFFETIPFKHHSI